MVLREFDLGSLSSIEIGAIGCFAYMVILKLLEIIKSRTMTSEKTAQQEFYKSFTEFQIQWRHTSVEIEKTKELAIESKNNQEIHYRELRHGQRNLQNTIQILSKEQ